MGMLYNPVYLVVVVVLIVVAKNIYDKLNVQEEMSMGLIPGLLALAPKVVPAVLEFGQETLEKLQAHTDEQARRMAQQTEQQQDRDTFSDAVEPDAVEPDAVDTSSRHSSSPLSAAMTELRQRTRVHNETRTEQ